jgi:hypothetical protein
LILNLGWNKIELFIYSPRIKNLTNIFVENWSVALKNKYKTIFLHFTHTHFLSHFKLHIFLVCIFQFFCIKLRVKKNIWTQKDFNRARLRSEAKLRCFFHTQSVYTKQHFVENKKRMNQRKKRISNFLFGFTRSVIHYFPCPEWFRVVQHFFSGARAKWGKKGGKERRVCVREGGGKEEGFKTHLKTHILRQTQNEKES